MGGAKGLEYTFLVFLVPLLAAAILALAALRTYPRDVATAAASREAVSRAEQRQAAGSRRRRRDAGQPQRPAQQPLDQAEREP